MRLWKNAKGDLITDDQVLAFIATHGSMQEALKEGDIELVAGDACQRRARKGEAVRHAKLSQYL